MRGDDQSRKTFWEYRLMHATCTILAMVVGVAAISPGGALVSPGRAFIAILLALLAIAWRPL
jgi:hypothetical protein